MKFHHTTVFEMAVVVSYVVYIGTILGISVLAPEYIDMVRDFIHIYVAIFLLWRFRPPFLGGEKIGVFGSFDRSIAFHAGIAMILAASPQYVGHITSTFGIR
jgi:hypothetical protein